MVKLDDVYHKKMINTYFIFFLLVTIFSISLGQTRARFQKIEQSQGLSNSGIIKEKNGFIWISTQNGLNRNIELTKEITLEHFYNVITFKFSTLKFPASNCEYAIKMEKFDDDWRNIGINRTATYKNLSSGSYIFKVKSKEIGAKWGKNFTSVKINILKPFWLTWWAYFIYFILALFFIKYSIAWGKLKSSLELEKLAHEKDNERYDLKQQLFTNISCDIRTPVTLILSSINRLFDRGDIFDSKQVKAAHAIRKNSNLLLRLVNELLDTKELKTNDIVLKVSKREFVSFSEEIFLAFSETAIDKDIEYNFKSDESSIHIWFDVNQLGKVVFNLLANAFRSTNNNGKIDVIIESNKDDVTLLVKDTGIGISSRHRSKIFNRSYPVKNSDDNKGFGLGLSIVKEIVQLHKGEISVLSEYGQGSTFRVKLLKGNTHFNNFNEAVEKEFNKNTVEKFQEEILIIEDNVIIQESLKEILEQENYSILQASNGVDGLKLASTSLPDLIISDVMMPKMDGMELSKKIRANSITSHIPIIILTSRTSTKDKMEGYEAGVDEYITKPYNEELLINRIGNLLKNRKLLKEKFINNNLLNPKELTINSQDYYFLENLYKSIEENLQSNNFKAQMISRNLNMSHSSMYKKIKALTGLTYIEFIGDYRLSIAKQLIEEMGYSVSEACYKVGYSDRRYFSKLFKNKFKQIPSFYLKS